MKPFLGHITKLALLVYTCSLLLLTHSTAFAGTLATRSDILSTSATSTLSNHTIRFTLANNIPANGKVVVTPPTSTFNIPVGLDYTDIDFKINSTDYSLASSAGTGSGGSLGVSVTSGSSGSITIILNDTDSITAGATIQIDIGTTAVFGTIGDAQITNPSSIGSYLLTITTKDSANATIDTGGIGLAISQPVGVSGTADPGTVATPIISPNGGTFTSSISVTITTTTSGASIYYTTDGTTPTTGSNLYTSAITISSSLTLKAFAVLATYTDSAVASSNFIIDTGSTSTGGGTYTTPTPTQTKTPSSALQYCDTRPADFNCDGRVNLTDLSILLHYWNSSASGIRADINKDGIVNLIDFSILVYWWTN